MSEFPVPDSMERGLAIFSDDDREIILAAVTRTEILKNLTIACLVMLVPSFAALEAAKTYMPHRLLLILNMSLFLPVIYIAILSNSSLKLLNAFARHKFSTEKIKLIAGSEKRKFWIHAIVIIFFYAAIATSPFLWLKAK